MDEDVREIREYVRHLKVLCPTSLDVQYFESLLEWLQRQEHFTKEADEHISTLEAKVKELEEGIERHKQWQISIGVPIYQEDKELYALLTKREGK